MNTNKEILIVDDEPGYRSLLNKTLKKAGYQTVMAQNGEEALVALWEKHHIGLVLLDMRLPVINGLDIFEIIRRNFPNKKIIVTNSLQKAVKQFLRYDVDGNYDKSENLSSLVEKVNKVLNNNRINVPIENNDKRHFERVPLNLIADCDRMDLHAVGACVHFLSYSKDISPYGGRFVVGEEIKVGEHFTMTLELPNNFLPLLVDCETVWVRKLEGSESKTKGNFEVGVRFVKIESLHSEKEIKSNLN